MPIEMSVQDKDWQVLHDRITATLNRFGKKDAFGKGDYWLVDDNWGWELHQLEFQNLELLRPQVIKSLQALLADFPRWEISVRVDAIGKEKEWPNMGLMVSGDEIIDGLQRQHLPPEVRFVYEGSKPPKTIDPNDKRDIFRRALKQE